MKVKGFSLIELLIAIAIAGILASIAYPSYAQYLLTSKRSEARAALIDIANRQEMYYLDHHEYATNLKTQLGFSETPVISENSYYEISTSSARATVGFTLTAKAINNQDQDTECATLSIDQNLNKTATTNDCWK